MLSYNLIGTQEAVSALRREFCFITTDIFTKPGGSADVNVVVEDEQADAFTDRCDALGVKAVML